MEKFKTLISNGKILTSNIFMSALWKRFRIFISVKNFWHIYAYWAFSVSFGVITFSLYFFMGDLPYDPAIHETGLFILIGVFAEYGLGTSVFLSGLFLIIGACFLIKNVREKNFDIVKAHIIHLILIALFFDNGYGFSCWGCRI